MISTAAWMPLNSTLATKISWIRFSCIGAPTPGFPIQVNCLTSPERNPICFSSRSTGSRRRIRARVGFSFIGTF
jgi:hypothetical protein